MRIQSAAVSDSACRHADPSRGGFVLRRPGERVVVAPVAEMKKAADRNQKVERRVELLPQRRRQQRLLVRPAALFLHCGDQRQPVRQVVVAQAARPIFHIGLEMKDGVAEFVVPARA